MSESQPYEEVTVASDGVSVTKRYEADEFPVPAIAFNFDSRRNERVTVRLSDTVPPDIAVEDLGFHPEYGSEYWTIEDDEITFEREFEPGAEYTTVYGIRATGTDDVEQFLTEPSIETVDPPLDDDGSELVGEGSDAVKDVIAGDADSVPGLEDVSDDDDIETLDLKDPNEEERVEENGQPASSTADDAGSEAAGAEPVELAGDSVVAAMAAEIRDQEVNKEDVQLLRKAFDLAAETDGSTAARLQKLRRDVNDVIAYTEALEEFLDENGTGDQIIEEFREEIEEFGDEIEQFGDEIESLDSDLRAVESQVEDNESTVSDLSTDIEGVESQMSDLEDQLADYESELSEIREQMSDDDVEGRIEEIRSEIEELKQWREQLSSVIGGGE